MTAPGHTAPGRAGGTVSVLIVEDSPSAAQLLSFILKSDPAIRVAGIAANGEEALHQLGRLSVDVVTMDINLPGMNGFETTRRIMETRPVPIVIVSSLVGSSPDASSPFRVMEEGALALLAKPPGPGHPDYEKRAGELVRTVKMISEIKVFRRKVPMARAAERRRSAAPASPPVPAVPPETAPFPVPAAPVRAGGRYRAVAVGASTGGPAVIKSIFDLLGPDFPLPILVVQHIAAGFTEGFADWIRKATGFPTRVARHGEALSPGTAYIAPDAAHMGLSKGGTIALDAARDPIHGMRPSVSFLFESFARALGGRGIGVILSGMGADGSKELGLIREQGGVTIAQEPASCIVPGMPGEAERLGSTGLVLPPEAIAKKLLSLAGE
jgi:two-component system chemotaxis response regulator CheB